MKVAITFLFALLLAAPARAADLTSSGGTFTLSGGAEANTLVAVDVMGAGTFFGDQTGTVTGLPPGCSPATPPVAPFSGVACLGVSAVVLNGGAGNDTAVANAGVPGTLAGGAGDDTLIGGTETDTFTGGDGTDVVGYLAPEGAGITRTTAVKATLPEPGAAPSTGNGQQQPAENDSIAADVEGLVGGQGNDILTGNGAANTIAGAAPPGTIGVTTAPAGTDTIVGGGGNDTLLAGDSGSVSGGEGNDQIVGGRDPAKTTTVTGGAGDDTLVSGLGDDDLAGGDGADTLAYASVSLAGLDRGTDGVTVTLPETGATSAGGRTGGDEQDVIHDDLETLAGSNGSDVLTGTARADTIAGSVPPGTPGVKSTPAGKDTIKGLGGNDQLVGGDTGTVNGGDGDDAVVGGSGATELFGDAGSDRIVSGTGNDSVHGGDGADFLVYAAVGLVSLKRDAGVTARLADGDQSTTGNGQAGESDTIFGDVENLVGGNGNDTLTGNAQPNTIVGVAPDGTAGVTPGPAGNDTIDGAAGDDIILGAAGNDTLTGGDGKDNVVAGAGDDRVLVRDTVAETPVCGDGEDVATVDATDTAGPDCETVDKPAAPVTPAPTAADKKKPKLTVTPRRLKLRAKRRVRLFVRCANEAKGCRGTARIAGVKRSFRIAGKARKAVTLRLGRKTVKRLRRRGKLVVKVRVTARDTAGNRAAKTVKVTLRRR